jgi:phenylacetate-CoA ligase
MKCVFCQLPVPEKALYLIVAVDDPKTLFLKMENMLGIEGVKRFFIQGLNGIFIQYLIRAEASVYYLEKAGYSFEIKLVEKEMV